jgi:hypothetical protein
MRAGLLSAPSVIDLINQKFVATWVLIDDLKKPSAEGNGFAETLQSNWEYPLDLMFLSSHGEFVSKLNSFRDLPAHPNVGHPGHFGNPVAPNASNKATIFFSHAMRFLQR